MPILTGALVGIGMAGAMTLLAAIMGKYIHAKVNITSWHVQYGSGTAMRLTGSDASMPVKRPGIYDRWLLVRFTIGFFAIR